MLVRSSVLWLLRFTLLYILCNNLWCADGDLRIVDRVERNGFVTGAVQVFIDGAFGAVCTSSFDPVDADVACRQLGFLGGTALPLAVDRRLGVTAPPVRLLKMGRMSTPGRGPCGSRIHFR